jgi:hypothetical protein
MYLVAYNSVNPARSAPPSLQVRTSTAPPCVGFRPLKSAASPCVLAPVHERGDGVDTVQVGRARPRISANILFKESLGSAAPQPNRCRTKYYLSSFGIGWLLRCYCCYTFRYMSNCPVFVVIKMHPFIVTSIVTQLFFRNTDYIKKKMEAQIEQHNKRENNISNIKQLNMQCTAPLDTS